MAKKRSYTLLKLLRGTETRPVEFLLVYLDPSATTADFAYVNQFKKMQFQGVEYAKLAWKRGYVQSATDDSATTMRIHLDDVDAELLARARKVKFSGARVVLKRAFVGNLDTSGVVITVFEGKSKDPTFAQGTMTLDVVGWVDAFDGELPQRKFQRACNYTLGGAGCGVDLDSYVVTGTAGAGSTVNYIEDASLSQASDYFDIGYVEITDTDSEMKGVQRGIYKYDTVNKRLYFRYPMQSSPAGLAYKAVPGCKKTAVDCADRYDNELNFGGFKEVPTKPEVPIGKKQ